MTRSFFIITNKNNMRRFKLALLFLAVCLISTAFVPARKTGSMKWMSLEEAKAAFAKEKKPILIDLYTDWCGWCKVMDKKTYTNAALAEYLQKNFYPVKLNAETRDAIQWGNKTYHFNAGYKTNEFAVFLTYGQLSFPTTVIIPTDSTGPLPLAGYLEPRDLEPVLRYFGEGRYGKQRFDDFKNSFKPSW